MKRPFLFLACVLLMPVFRLSAQEGPPAPAAPASGQTPPAIEGPADAAVPAEEAPAAAPVDGAPAGGDAEDGSAPADGDAADGESGADAAADGDTAASYLEMDIKTSSLMELAAWCRELGLSDGGSKDDLASRLRSHYELPSPKNPAVIEERVITIESARATEYFTLDVVDEEYARLKGDVMISLKDGEAVHRIKAWEILYNRTRNVMTATGNVEYVKEDGDTIETFKGDSITVNLDNWSSIFLDGVSERSVAGNMTAYRFAGTVISRNAEEVTVLTGADITNPSNEEAYWSLHASKLWLLPGNDWAILNAVLKVGNIPLLYLPFFYYPADEIVFHPVLGGRTREGTFLQTTTYILGRPKISESAENSLTRIFGGSSQDMEQKREGIFLRSTGKKRQNVDEARLSVLFDAYVNLGAYLGTELALPKKGPFGEFALSAGMGLTRNIYPIGDANTPFPKYDGVSEWNKAKFFSLDSPVRYRLKMTGSAQAARGSLSWAIPYYSDPYVDRDFMRRTEIFDWLSMLREGASSEEEEEESYDDYLGSYEWRLTGSFNPQFPKLAPYVNSVSVSSASSSLLFNHRYSAKYQGPATPPNPGRSFFFPDRFTMYSLSAAVAGVPYTWGNVPAAPAGTETKTAAPGDALLPDLPRPPWETASPGENQEAAASQDVHTLTPPALAQTFTLAGGGLLPQFALDYRLAPSAASELQFRSSEANWKELEDVDWAEASTVLSRFRGDGSLGFTFSHPESGAGGATGGAYSATFRLSGIGSWQDYAFFNEDAEEFSANGATYGAPDEAKIKAAKNRARNETYFTSSWDTGATVRPFYHNAVWSNSNVQYTLKGLMAKKTFDPAAAAPTWEWDYGAWEEDYIETHQVSANVAANVMDHNQTLTVTAVLPPKDALLSGNATFRAWITETSLRSQVTNPWESERKFEPIYLTETFRFGALGSFSQYVVFEPERKGLDGEEEAHLTTLTSNLSFSGLTASYSAVYSRPFKFNPDYGAGSPALWIQDPDESLAPRELRLGYIKTFAREKLWKERLSFSLSVNSSLAFDLQRYTNSRMSFGLGVNIGIANFLDLKLSTNSENSVIYRYFQNLPFFDAPPAELYSGYETNFFVDLFNSFRLTDEDARRRSGFKLKSLNLSFIHHLGDWNARLSVAMTPFRPEGSTSYQFKNEISFLIQWVPIEEIKTDITYIDEKLSVK